MALVISPGVTTVGTTSSDQSGGAITIQADASGTTVTKSGNTITLGVSGTIPGSTATANKWTTARTVTFAGGDVTGSFTIDGSADVSNVALTVGADKVELGTDTTGNYVASLTAGTGVSVGAAGEGATPSIAIGQAVGTTDNVTFNNVTVSGSLTVNGTTTTINSTTISVDDKNIELGSVTSPTNTTADGGGITLKGATDKTFNWVNATSAWTSSEHVALASGKNVLLNGSTSGTITLAVAAAAGTNTVTFPATTGNVVTTGDSATVTNTMLAGSIANNKLANSTISGVALGSNLNTLTLGSYLTGSSYNGTGAVTAAVDATSANTASKVVARDASGNFSAGTITASLTGNVNGNVSGSSGSCTGNAATATTAGSITGQANSATITAASTNTASTIVLRDGSGNFNAGTITATFSGNLTGNVTGNVTGSSGSCTGNAATATTAGSITGQANSATITATSNNTANQIVLRDGSGNFSCGVMTGTATAARYSDLAENYVADAAYEPGTVLMIGGEKEVTLAQNETRKVAGVVSTAPAHLMNSDCIGEFVVAIALTGRVPCKVVGSVKKGDLMISAGDGRAKSVGIYDPKIGQVIGKALESFNGELGVVEVMVGRF